MYQTVINYSVDRGTGPRLDFFHDREAKVTTKQKSINAQKAVVSPSSLSGAVPCYPSRAIHHTHRYETHHGRVGRKMNREVCGVGEVETPGLLSA